jgi:hypothetical protein
MREPTPELKAAMDRLATRNAENKQRRLTTVWEHPQPLKEWQAHGLTCMVLAGPASTNGYVTVPRNHPFYGVAYSDCPQGCGESWCGHSPASVIYVHGGITFSSLGSKGWIFGFDTCHSDDASQMKKKPKKIKQLCFCCEGTYTKHEKGCPLRKESKK